LVQWRSQMSLSNVLRRQFNSQWTVVFVKRRVCVCVSRTYDNRMNVRWSVIVTGWVHKAIISTTNHTDTPINWWRQWLHHVHIHLATFCNSLCQLDTKCQWQCQLSCRSTVTKMSWYYHSHTSMSKEDRHTGEWVTCSTGRACRSSGVSSSSEASRLSTSSSWLTRSV